jgi:hypothetical protein
MSRPNQFFFVVWDDTLVVFAVLHAARHDRIWRERI